MLPAGVSLHKLFFFIVSSGCVSNYFPVGFNFAHSSPVKPTRKGGAGCAAGGVAGRGRAVTCPAQGGFSKHVVPVLIHLSRGGVYSPVVLGLH